MQDLIAFLLATTGLTMIVTKSSLFKPFRVYISTIYADKSNKKLLNKGKDKTLFFFSWLDAILSCPMCFSVYAGALLSVVIYFSQFYNQMIYITYIFAGVPVASIIIQYWAKVERGK